MTNREEVMGGVGRASKGWLIWREECEMGDNKVNVWEEKSRLRRGDRWCEESAATILERGRGAQTVDFTPHHSDWKCRNTHASHTHAI